MDSITFRLTALDTLVPIFMTPATTFAPFEHILRHFYYRRSFVMALLERIFVVWGGFRAAVRSKAAQYRLLPFADLQGKWHLNADSKAS